MSPLQKKKDNIDLFGDDSSSDVLLQLHMNTIFYCSGATWCCGPFSTSPALHWEFVCHFLLNFKINPLVLTPWNDWGLNVWLWINLGFQQGDFSVLSSGGRRSVSCVALEQESWIRAAASLAVCSQSWAAFEVQTEHCVWGTFSICFPLKCSAAPPWCIHLNLQGV